MKSNQFGARQGKHLAIFPPKQIRNKWIIGGPHEESHAKEQDFLYYTGGGFTRLSGVMMRAFDLHMGGRWFEPNPAGSYQTL